MFAHTHAIRARENQETLSVLGTAVHIVCQSEGTAGAYSLFRTQDPAGSGPPPHFHTRETESMYVLQGRYQFTVDGADSILSPGDFVTIPPRIPHHYLCLGPENGELLVLTTPGGYEGFFREIDRASQGSPCSTEEVLAIARKFGVEILLPSR